MITILEKSVSFPPLQVRIRHDIALCFPSCVPGDGPPWESYLNVLYTQQELINSSSHTHTNTSLMYLFFVLLRFLNLTIKTKSLKIWMLQWWLLVIINCPRQLQITNSAACKGEGTILSPSFSTQIHSAT